MEGRKVCIVTVAVLVIGTSLLFKELSTSDRIMSSLYSDDSKIKGAGRGIFTSKPIRKGAYLFTSIIDKRVTPQGAMINHCNKPNTEQYKKGKKPRTRREHADNKPIIAENMPRIHLKYTENMP